MGFSLMHLRFALAVDMRTQADVLCMRAGFACRSSARRVETPVQRPGLSSPLGDQLCCRCGRFGDGRWPGALQSDCKRAQQRKSPCSMNRTSQEDADPTILIRLAEYAWLPELRKARRQSRAHAGLLEKTCLQENVPGLSPAMALASRAPDLVLQCFAVGRGPKPAGRSLCS